MTNQYTLIDLKSLALESVRSVEPYYRILGMLKDYEGKVLDADIVAQIKQKCGLIDLKIMVEHTMAYMCWRSHNDSSHFEKIFLSYDSPYIKINIKEIITRNKDFLSKIESDNEELNKFISGQSAMDASDCLKAYIQTTLEAEELLEVSVIPHLPTNLVEILIKKLSYMASCRKTIRAMNLIEGVN